MKDYTVNIQLAQYGNEEGEDKETGILFDVYGKKVKGRFRLASGIFVKDKHFNRENKEVKRSDSHHSTKNFRLKQRLTATEAICERLVNEGTVITKDYLKQHLDFISTNITESPFLDRFDEFMKSKKNEISDTTKEKYNQLKKRLIEVSGHTKRVLSFENIDSRFEADFKDYSFNEKGNHNNGYGIYVKNLKVFMNWATEQNLNKNLAFRKFKVLSEDKDIFPLEFHEIATLEKKTLEGDYELVRNMFLLQCYTGMALGDIIDLKHSHISNGVIRKKRIKTQVDCYIPITPQALRIINIYGKGKGKTDTIFPFLAEYNISKYLKEVFKQAELTRLVTYERTQGATVTQHTAKLSDVVTPHDGRRTFITCCLRRGMNHEMIMKITGHKTYTEFRKYVKFSEGEIKITLLNAWDRAE